MPWHCSHAIANCSASFIPTVLPPSRQTCSAWRCSGRPDINAGFVVLKDTVLRARHLLELAGHPVHVESTTVSDTDFLMAQMEMREQLDEAESLAQMAELRADADDWLQNLAREFAIDYRDGDWSEAGDTVRKMQFMSRFIEEVCQQEAQLEDDEFDEDLD